MNTQQILIVLMALMFIAGSCVGHAVGYLRRREQIATMKQHLRIAYGRIRVLEVAAHDVRRNS